MTSDDFTKNNYNSKSCNQYIGTYTINAECCPCEESSHDCCCNETKDICFEPCETIKKDFIDVYPSCGRRVLVLHVNLKKICPNKIIMVYVLIYENNKLYAVKVKRIYTGYFLDCKCRNLYAGKFCFAFNEYELCRHRKFQAKVIFYYMNF